MMDDKTFELQHDLGQARERMADYIKTISEQSAELARLRAENAELRADAERLAFLYSGVRTLSSALIDIELILLNGDVPTIDEVRAAIDAARNHSEPVQNKPPEE
jgi:chromosome segregation ATPase